MIGKHQILISLIILITSTSGCSLFSGKTGNAELLLPVTEIGTPEGTKATKDIGSAGGTLASPDGRLTLTVQPNALAETVSFSIQSITNKADGGLGNAYRLEPSGKTFTPPLEISIHYDDHDLEGTVPEALSLAYQDGQGAWRVQKSARLDKDKKTLTISTTHFTDFSFLTRLRINPVSDTIHPGESVGISAVICEEKQSLIDRLLSRAVNCTTVKMADSMWSLSGAGTITTGGTNSVIYTAPGKKPTPNVVHVILNYEYENWDDSKLIKVKAYFASAITIVDRGYKAVGNDGPVKYSGIICSLEKPFNINGIHPLLFLPLKFVPSSEKAGTMSYSAANGSLSMTGNGTYTVEGLDTDKPRIVPNVKSTGSVRVASASGSGLAHIDLVPLDTNECSGQ